MKELSERNSALLIMGLKTMGTMKEAYFYVEEELYVDEAEELYDFCEWVDENVGGCSSYNIEILFKAYKNPDNVELQEIVADLRTKIAEIRKSIEG